MVELGRSYFDADLVLGKQRRVLNATTQALTQFVRNNGGHGPIYRSIGPTGLYTDAGFDALGRAVSLTRAQDATTLLEQTNTTYDEAGRPLQVLRHLLDANGQSLGTAATSYDYDIWSNVVRVTDPDGRTMHGEHDAYGRLKKQRDGLSAQPGQNNEVELEYLPGRDLVVKTTQRIFDDGPIPAQKSYVTELELDLVGCRRRRESA